MGKTAASVFLSCSSMVIKDATPLITPSTCAELILIIFKCKQHTSYDPRGQEKKHEISLDKNNAYKHLGLVDCLKLG